MSTQSHDHQISTTIETIPDSQLAKPTKYIESAVEPEGNSKSSKDKAKISTIKQAISTSYSLKKSPPAKHVEAISKSESALFSDGAVVQPDTSSPLVDKTAPDLASKQAASLDLKNIPLVKNNALLSSVFGKMAAVKLPQIGFANFNINLVSIFIALGMASFWLFMIFSALCGSRDRGMRARLSEHRKNDD
jgi:hypothetical protein